MNQPSLHETLRYSKAVFFDAGHTLIFPDYDLIGDTLRKHGVNRSAADLRELDCRLRIAFNRRAFDGDTSLECWDQYWDTWLHQAGVRGDSKGTAMDELMTLSRQGLLWTGVEEGTHQVLRELKQKGKILGVVSNSEGRLELFLRQAGLHQYFKFILDSQVVGFSKPDPGIFRLALEMAGVSAGEALFIGDVYCIDVLGARAAGLEVALLIPSGSVNRFDCMTVQCLHELTERVN